MGALNLLAPAPLGAGHRLDGFDSGEASLDDWLRRRARTNQASGASRCYVVAEETLQVVGYYALASGALANLDAPGRLRRNMPDPIPMAILGRLAVDRTRQGQGLGTALLQDAVQRAAQAARLMGIRGVLVHALSESARQFYDHHGFIALPRNPAILVLSLHGVAG